MKCQILFSGKNKKNISKCLLKILPRVLSVKKKQGCQVAEIPVARTGQMLSIWVDGIP